MKRFEDYKREVILAYKKKKEERKLPYNLQDSTPASLRNECLDVFHKRYSHRDSHIFKVLYGEKDSPAEYFQKIKAAGADKFKPLDNFLKGITADTKKINIELLAWLMELAPYKDADPYDFGETEQYIPTTKTEVDNDLKVQTQSGETNEIETKDLSKNNESIKEEVQEPPSITLDDTLIITEIINIPRKFNKTLIAFSAVFIILTVIYIKYRTTDHQCMYWNKDHYESITCDQKVDGATIVPVDTFKLAHLRKITDISLITRNGIGKIHYSKVNGKPEFYTTGGENPEDSKRRLLPMSEFMYEKYVLKKTQP